MTEVCKPSRIIFHDMIENQVMAVQLMTFFPYEDAPKFLLFQ